MSIQTKKACLLDLNRKMNVAHINMCTSVEGPFKRMAIWFQGCNIMCKGCCNPELQELKVAHIMTVSELVNIAVYSKNKYGIEGVTFLGGEPTMQKGLSDLSQALSTEGLGTILFTGRAYNSIEDEIKNSVDLIVDGEFDISQIDTQRNLVGSKNQNIIYVTERYRKSKEWFLDLREKMVEINFKHQDELFINGDVIW